MHVDYSHFTNINIHEKIFFGAKTRAAKAREKKLRRMVASSTEKYVSSNKGKEKADLLIEN